jgi:hypothetical protein
MASGSKASIPRPKEVGRTDGEYVGFDEGTSVGSRVKVGISDGTEVGRLVGTNEGSEVRVGMSDGTEVGVDVGTNEGSEVRVGMSDGIEVGLLVGYKVGRDVGSLGQNSLCPKQVDPVPSQAVAPQPHDETTLFAMHDAQLETPLRSAAKEPEQPLQLIAPVPAY